MASLVCRSLLVGIALLTLLLLCDVLDAQTSPVDKEAFFEAKIRPVLIEACYSCHNSADRAEGSLAVDSREALRKGGDRGAAIVVGKGNESLLVQSLQHQDDDLRMPAESGKLKPAVIADFIRWIDDGAVDPRDNPPSKEELAQDISWEQTRARRSQWWSFQRLGYGGLLPQKVDEWSEHPVDRFIRVKQKEAGLEPAPPADPAVLLRRVSLLLTGVPPTIEETTAFVADPSPEAYRAVVDRLLQSPRFGERWARHWMDWLRFAESHGSEGDPAIPHAWKYRDYLIRALNADVPMDQLVREHIEGDLLREPRINKELGINESALGIGHFRMVQHGYAPTDALDEQVRFVDNQIDVLSKAFLGLTVSCARCHNHKFDPISQEDYFALYGIFASCRPGTITIDTAERAATNQAELRKLKSQMKPPLVAAWKEQAGKLKDALLAFPQDAEQLTKAAADPTDSLHLWAKMQAVVDDDFTQQWSQQVQAFQATQQKIDAANQFHYPLHWKLDEPADYAQWHASGNGLPKEPTTAGDFTLQRNGSAVIDHLLPAGVFTHSLSTKHNGVLTSPRFQINCDEIWVRVAGNDNARARYVVQNYPRVVLIYPHTQIKTEKATWFHWDARYWKGENAHIEIVTGDDQPIDVGSNEGQSWFGITEVIGRNLDQPAPVEPASGLLTLLNDEMLKRKLQSKQDLAQLYKDALAACVAAWEKDRATNAQAAFLDALLQRQLLPNTSSDLPDLAPLVQKYRQLEAEIPLPTRAPGVHESEGFNQRLFARGDHHKPLAEVQRGYLKVFGPYQFKGPGSRRQDLAEMFRDSDNPLVPRVIANRLWLHLFGEGLVTTPDNFGLLSEEPVHKELLDYLASHIGKLTCSRFGEFDPGSIKSFLRHLVLSKTFQQSSKGSAAAAEKDPSNSLWTHFPARRLEAEAIRDSLLAISVGLDETMGGPSVNGNSRRRSVYVRVQRNNLDPLLTTFDMPEPATTRGKRDATNVPAQSLTLLNDPFVRDLARRWGDRIRQDASLATDAQRVTRMLHEAGGRLPREEEVQLALRFLNASAEAQAQTAQQLAQLQTRTDELQAQIAHVLNPVRQKLLEQQGKPKPTADAPQPVARWAFDENLQDSIGNLHAQFRGLKGEEAAPTFRAGALVLDGKHFAATSLLPTAITAKTLEAWVQLDNLDQRGGAVVSLEAPNGSVFDALVFGEKDPRQWLAGSDFFHRTQTVQGKQEDIVDQPVHVAAVYDANGQITLYRAGQPYGKSYASGTPLKFAADEAHLLFGLRHSPPSPGRFLTGKIFEARLYDRALSAEEIARSAAGGEFVSQAQILAALSPAEREQVEQLQQQVAGLNLQMKELVPADWENDPAAKWQALAQALFSWKEFLYVY